MVLTSKHNGDLQLAVNDALATNDDVEVDDNVVPLKTLTDTLKIESFDPISGTYKQVSLTITGRANFWDKGNRSVLNAAFTDRPIIGIQKAKGVRIIGLNIKGPVGGEVTGIDTRFNAFAGISIDYLDPRARGDMSRGASTGVVIDNCTIGNVVLGIVASINGWTQNGENFTYSNCRFGHNKYGIVGCQQQEKNNRIENVGCWSRSECFLHFGEYGEGGGGHYVWTGGNLATSVKKIVNRLSGGAFPLVIKELFAERVNEIGYWYCGGVGDTLVDSVIDVAHPNLYGFPDAHLRGTGLKFNNSIIRLYGYSKIPMLLNQESKLGYMEDTNQGSYVSPVRGWYYQAASKYFDLGYYMTRPAPRQVVNPVGSGNAKTLIVSGLLAAVGDTIFFTKMGNSGWAGMGLVTAANTISYISPGVAPGTLYDLWLYHNGVRPTT